MQEEVRTCSFIPGLLQSPIRCRWALNSSAWDLSNGDKQHFLSLLPCEERAACTRFHWKEDQKQALASRVLQRLLGSIAFRIPLPSVQISRSSSGKPFFVGEHSACGKVNFNVSHEVRQNHFVAMMSLQHTTIK